MNHFLSVFAPIKGRLGRVECSNRSSLLPVAMLRLTLRHSGSVHRRRCPAGTSAARRLTAGVAPLAAPVVPVVSGTGNTSVEAAVLLGARVVHDAAGRWEDIRASTFDEAQALLVWRMGGAGADATTLSRFRKLRVLVRVGVGYDNIDLQAAGRLGIAVCNVPAYGVEEVADTALAHILALYRRTHLLGSRVASGAISSSLNSVVQAEAQGASRIRGQRLGIVGLGRIGTAVALRAKPFGFEVSIYSSCICLQQANS